MNFGSLWNKFSPNKSVFDLWEFREPWLKGFGYKPHFIHLKDGKNEGLLPLWYDEEENAYMFVGGDWPEDNTFFANSTDMIKRLIEKAPRPLQLTGLVPFDGMDFLKRMGDLKADTDLKYVLPLENVFSMEELLAKFQKKYRYNLRYDYKRIIARNPDISWSETKNPECFDEYAKLKNIVFNDSGKDENYYLDQRRIMTFRMIIENARQYKVRVLKITVDGILAGIDIVLVYNGTYYLLGGAYDTKRFPGVGNAALYLLFEDAIRQNAGLVDCLQEDDGWKHRYFRGQELYIFERR